MRALHLFQRQLMLGTFSRFLMVACATMAAMCLQFALRSFECITAIWNRCPEHPAHRQSISSNRLYGTLSSPARSFTEHRGFRSFLCPRGLLLLMVQCPLKNPVATAVCALGGRLWVPDAAPSARDMDLGDAPLRADDFPFLTFDPCPSCSHGADDGPGRGGGAATQGAGSGSGTAGLATVVRHGGSAPTQQ